MTSQAHCREINPARVEAAEPNADMAISHQSSSFYVSRYMSGINPNPIGKPNILSIEFFRDDLRHRTADMSQQDLRGEQAPEASITDQMEHPPAASVR
ncbi:MAG: hypothetical protein BZY88_16590 [SAR202 cluster bacterium Io17-Chloro-G9]|nr:MAG: hypothetical protein BZY88_16590 [SAR202 cluster bacterium Io17-Chloro-G9]